MNESQSKHCLDWTWAGVQPMTGQSCTCSWKCSARCLFLIYLFIFLLPRGGKKKKKVGETMERSALKPLRYWLNILKNINQGRVMVAKVARKWYTRLILGHNKDQYKLFFLNFQNQISNRYQGVICEELSPSRVSRPVTLPEGSAGKGRTRPLSLSLLLTLPLLAQLWFKRRGSRIDSFTTTS